LTQHDALRGRPTKNLEKDSNIACTTLEDEIKEVEEKLEVHKQVIDKANKELGERFKYSLHNTRR
jgi:hypothetical protein